MARPIMTAWLRALAFLIIGVVLVVTGASHGPGSAITLGIAFLGLALRNILGFRTGLYLAWTFFALTAALRVGDFLADRRFEHLGLAILWGLMAVRIVAELATPEPPATEPRESQGDSDVPSAGSS